MVSHMPKHIISGLKYLTAVELRKKGHNQREIAEELDMDRFNSFTLFKW